MNKGLWVMLAVAGVALSGCGSKHSSVTGPGSTGSSGATPSDFADFVNSQVQTQPAFGSTPAQTTSLTSDLATGDATAFASVQFGTGDALPAGTNQASVACTQAGKTVCNPTVSADLNSNLN